MAQFVSVRLSRTDTSPWGFRLQGGKDFGQPLLIQKVNGGSLAEKAGLQVGDALVRVNNVDVQDLRHKDAQDTIVRAGNNFEVHVQRGGSTTWRPHVSPVGHVPSPGGRSPQTVTKTSLTAKPSAGQIPSGHNISPKPFGSSSTPQMNGGDSVKAIVNKQYNTPVGIYSEETIAETLSAQAEVLAGGVLGVNFMKNEKTYDSQKSEVFKMLQEAEKEPREPEPDHVSTFQPSTPLSTVNTPTIPITGLRHVAPPEAKPPSSPQASLAPGQNICADCERLIVGVFVRIKDKNLHVECFKCATCGTSLKNVGYYNINNKLYCDIHAKMVARQNPPAPNVDPITVPPGGRVPSGAYSTPSVTTNLPSTLSSVAPQSPPGTIAPMPFHTSNAPGPKPFGSQPAAPAPPFSAPVPPSSVPFSAPVPPISAPFSAPAPPVLNISTPKPQTAKDAVITNQPDTLIKDLYPECNKCNKQIKRGPFITALGKIWCPEHFICVNAKCRRPLQDIGFVEEADGLYCEYCFEQYLAPTCDKCNAKIKGDCLNAIGKHFHPECFRCAYCEKLFGNNPFFLEDALPYCETDWNELFTTKCFSCGFPIEAGDRWVEALSNNYHSQCFNCTMCKKNLEGQSFYAKGGRPYCKNHAR
uniref:Putative adaptor protein enigma n=1 Tax=Triatoma dimidiata TaxID=72491 RepID=A0A0V0G8G5_TRIDM